MDRKNAEAKYKWDLSAIYRTEADFDAELAEVERMIATFPAHESKMCESAENLLSALRDDTAIAAASNRGPILMTLPSSRGFTLTVSPDAGGEKPRKVDVHFEGAQTEGNVTSVGDGSGSITVSTGGSLEVTPFEVSPLHSI
jgi:hypothetical protein